VLYGLLLKRFRVFLFFKARLNLMVVITAIEAQIVGVSVVLDLFFFVALGAGI
jgi:hypothetical protein